MTERPGVLLVEDDRDLSALLVELLEGEGYDVTLARDGQQGLHLGLVRRFDVLVVDRRLPAIEGVELLGRLRGRGIRTPALFLTARGSVADRVQGLDAGAEDYLVKPFEVDELLARLRALLRRNAEQATTMRIGAATFDVPARTVSLAHGDVLLSERESALLRLFAIHPQRVFGRPELLELVFSAADGTGVVDTYVHYLRRKLGQEVVQTVRGLGYRLGPGWGGP